MKDSESLAQMARSLKEIAAQQTKQTRILETINSNLVQMSKLRSVSVEPEPTEEESSRTNVFGWVIAAEMQRTGQLKVGDVKIDEDETCWVWVGDSWERVEVKVVPVTGEET